MPSFMHVLKNAAFWPYPLHYTEVFLSGVWREKITVGTETHEDLWLQLHTQKDWPALSVGEGRVEGSSSSVWPSLSISHGGVTGYSRSIYWKHYMILEITLNWLNLRCKFWTCLEYFQKLHLLFRKIDWVALLLHLILWDIIHRDTYFIPKTTL